MFAIAVTDKSWYEYQKEHDFIDNINFWTPTVWKVAFDPGDIIVFKLKGTIDDIGGYGSFVEYKHQTLEQSWKEFGQRNGYDTKEEFVMALTKGKGPSSTICGCLVLENVVYFDQPEKLSKYGLSFNSHIVKYRKEYSPFPSFGQQSVVASQPVFQLVTQSKKQKTKQKVTLRVGQGQFHRDISVAYGHKCCITGETAPELLQAAHIQDYINKDSNHVQNGLLLRMDIHKLFDSGLLYIDENYKVHVSSLVKSTNYTDLNNQKISRPTNPSEWPSIDALKFKKESFRE